MKRIFLGLITLMFLGSGVAYATGPYTTSAHGDSSDGVDRKSPFPAYGVGNCAHCHEQHASIAGTEPDPKTGDAAGPDKFCLLANNFDTAAIPGSYAEDDNACFYCHTSNLTCLQDGGITNNDYSTTFGGASGGVTGIMQAFNQTSYHNLKDVLDFAVGEWPPPTYTFTADSNPCSACHNVHIAKRNKAYPGNPAYTAISKPSAHDELWGDDDADPDERMTNSALYGAYYQPPYYDSSTNIEPDGVGSDRATQAGKTPDYVTFCQDCHTTQMHTSPYAFGLTNTPINWATTGGESGGDKHGKNVATGGVDLDEPYASEWGLTNGLVLACTDCHEPHGAPNVMLIRKEVNGAALDTITTIAQTGCTPAYPTGNKELGHLCNRCHEDDLDHYGGVAANRWYWVHHASSDRPYVPTSCKDCHSSGGSSGYTSDRNPINCNCCHYHGSSAASRRTF